MTWGNIFLYHRIFTAHPLAECLWFTFRHLYKSHDSIIKEADDIYKTFSRIVEERNDIVHGQLVYYSSIEVDNLDANYISRLLAEVGDKRKVHKDGMAVKKLPDVNRLAHLIRELRMLDKRLGDLVFATRPLTMERPSFLGTSQDP